MLLCEGLNRKSCFVRFSACTCTSRILSRKSGNSVFRKVWYEMHTADFVGLYTATGSAEFGPPPLGGPCGPPRTLWHAPLPLTWCGSSISVRYIFAVWGCSISVRYISAVGECSVKRSLLGFRTLTPLCKLDCAL